MSEPTSDTETLARKVQQILDVPLHRHLGLVFDGHADGQSHAHFDVGPESAAFGGAIQALWARECAQHGTHPISEHTDKFVRFGRAVHVPQPKNVERYRAMYARQLNLSTAVRPLFTT